MGERLPIPGELPCVNCEYLLRGLTADQRCPECGTEIMQTLLGNRLYALSISGEHVPDRMKAAILVVSQTVFPFDAILLVHATVKAAFKRAKVPGQRVSVNAADICTEFRHHVKRFFMTRRDAELFLNRWGLRTSEDLGRIVKSMTRTGLFRASEHASPESFNGLFTLENLFQCGTDVLNSVRATTRGFPELAEIRREIARERFRPAAEAAGCTIDAIMFVSDALRLAMWLAQGTLQKPRHVTAAQVCAAVRAQARDYFNDEAEAIELLNEWGIRSSENVGRIIFAMVDARLIQAQDGDSVEQFNGLFTLDNFF